MATRRSPPLQDEPPAADTVTDYDLGHTKTYLRLLDAHAEGADWAEAVEVILGLNPSAEPERARRIYDSHIARARWITQHGYRDLLRRADDVER
jgi:hypothetical protein